MKDYCGQDLSVGDYILTYYDSCGNMMVGKIYKIKKRVWFNEVATYEEGICYRHTINYCRIPDRLIKIDEGQVNSYLNKKE